MHRRVHASTGAAPVATPLPRKQRCTMATKADAVVAAARLLVESDVSADPNLVFIGETVAVSVIFGLIVVSWLISYLDEYGRKHKHTGEVINRAYRETMLLGLVAFVLFIVEQAAGSGAGAQEVLHETELIHVALWSIVIVYILWIVLLLYQSRRIGDRWRLIETAATDFAEYRTLRLRLVELGEIVKIRPDEPAVLLRPEAVKSSGRILRQLCRHPAVGLEYYRTLHKTRYLEQRYRFIRRNHLPSDFAFSTYLVECKQHVFLKLVEIPVGLWALIAFLISFDVYLRSQWPWYRSAFDSSEAIVALCIAAVLLSVAVWTKMRTIHWRMFHSEFAALQVPPEVVRQAAEWESILPAGSGFGMSMRIRRPSAAGASLQYGAAGVTEGRIRSGGPSMRGYGYGGGGGIEAMPNRRRTEFYGGPAYGSFTGGGGALTGAGVGTGAGSEFEFDTGSMIGRGDSLVLRAQELEEELAERLGVIPSHPPPLSSPEVDAGAGEDTIGLPRPRPRKSNVQPGSAAPPLTGALGDRGSTAAVSGPPSPSLAHLRQPQSIEFARLQQTSHVPALLRQVSEPHSPVLPGGDIDRQHSEVEILTEGGRSLESPPTRGGASASSFRLQRALSSSSSLHLPQGQPTAESPIQQQPPGGATVTSPAFDIHPGLSLARSTFAAVDNNRGGALGSAAGGGRSDIAQSLSQGAEIERERHRRHLEVQRKLFWFGQPVLLLRLMQAVPFIFALSIALLALFFNTNVGNYKTFIATFVGIGVGVLLCVGMLGEIVPLYVLSIHVSDLVDTRLLAQAVLKHEQGRAAERKRMARLGSTLPALYAAGGEATKRSIRMPAYQYLFLRCWRCIRCRDVSYPNLRYRTRIFLRRMDVQMAITLLAIALFFMLAVTSSPWIVEPYRRGVYITAVVIAAILALELFVRIWAHGPINFFLPRYTDAPAAAAVAVVGDASSHGLPNTDASRESEGRVQPATMAMTSVRIHDSATAVDGIVGGGSTEGSLEGGPDAERTHDVHQEHTRLGQPTQRRQTFVARLRVGFSALFSRCRVCLPLSSRHHSHIRYPTLVGRLVDCAFVGACVTAVAVAFTTGGIDSNGDVDNKGAPMYVAGVIILRILRMEVDTGRRGASTRPRSVPAPSQPPAASAAGPGPLEYAGTAQHPAGRLQWRGGVDSINDDRESMAPLSTGQRPTEVGRAYAGTTVIELPRHSLSWQAGVAGHGTGSCVAPDATTTTAAAAAIAVGGVGDLITPAASSSLQQQQGLSRQPSLRQRRLSPMEHIEEQHEEGADGEGDEAQVLRQRGVVSPRVLAAAVSDDDSAALAPAAARSAMVRPSAPGYGADAGEETAESEDDLLGGSIEAASEASEEAEEEIQAILSPTTAAAASRARVASPLPPALHRRTLAHADVLRRRPRRPSIRAARRAGLALSSPVSWADQEPRSSLRASAAAPTASASGTWEHGGTGVGTTAGRSPPVAAPAGATDELALQSIEAQLQGRSSPAFAQPGESSEDVAALLPPDRALWRHYGLEQAAAAASSEDQDWLAASPSPAAAAAAPPEAEHPRRDRRLPRPIHLREDSTLAAFGIRHDSVDADRDSLAAALERMRYQLAAADRRRPAVAAAPSSASAAPSSHPLEPAPAIAAVSDATFARRQAVAVAGNGDRDGAAAADTHQTRPPG